VAASNSRELSCRKVFPLSARTGRLWLRGPVFLACLEGMFADSVVFFDAADECYRPQRHWHRLQAPQDAGGSYKYADMDSEFESFVLPGGRPFC